MKLEEKDLEQLYEYCKKVGPGDRYFKEYEDKILASKDPRWNYLFASNVKGADIKAHGQAIIESKNPFYNTAFAKEIKGADVKTHGHVVIASTNPKCNYEFAMYIKDADIEAHRQVVNASGNKEWIDRFEKDIPSTNKKTQSENKTSKDPAKINTDPYYKSKKLRELIIDRNKIIQTLVQ